MPSKADKAIADTQTLDRLPEPNRLFIGQGVAAREVVLVADSVTVDGLLEGDIAVTSLLVNRTGTIRGRITVARNAEIFGTVLEKLDVKGDLVLRAGGRVAATVSYGRLLVEQGASISGDVSSPDQRVVSQPAQAPVPQPAPPDRDPGLRLGNGVAPAVERLDLAVLDWMPGPVAATQ